jgi:polysaccharide pyruvyl transferase WcaK-like protein
MRSTAQGGIFLSGYFGCGNLGDDLLLSAALAQLRLIVPDAQFLIRDSGDTGSLGNLGADVNFTRIEAILADQKSSKVYRLAHYLARLVTLLRRCGWVIFAGGTVFHDQNRGRSLLVQWLICRLARFLNVRIAAIGVGVSELRSARVRWFLRDIVRISDLFLVRDGASLRQCSGTAARLTADLVFAWRELGTSLKVRDRAPRASGATIALALSPGAFEGASEERAVAAFSEAVRIWKLHGHRIIFLIFQKSGISRGDQAMFARITAGLGPDMPVETRTLTALPREIQATYACVDTLCGMRFHGFVLAALSGIPFVGVAHDKKISEICRRFDMCCLDANAFDGKTLARAVEASLRSRPDPIVVEASIGQASENFRALAGCMK